MTRVLSERRARKVNGCSISDHLSSHVHLTNSIHLKNHMHRQVHAVAADRAHLVTLRSLEDPCESPPSWPSPPKGRRRLSKSKIGRGDNGGCTRVGRGWFQESHVMYCCDHSRPCGGTDFVNCIVSGGSELGVGKKESYRNKKTFKTHSDRDHRWCAAVTKVADETETDIWCRGNHIDRSIVDFETQNRVSVASNSLDDDRVHSYSCKLHIPVEDQPKKETAHKLQTERHQSLTQKYKPRTFKDLVGHNLVSQALSNTVAKRKVGWLYAFHGPHGTGKTTCARIFARALTCQSLESPKPCGICDSCAAYDAGESRNVREISPVSSRDFKNAITLLSSVIGSGHQSHCKVFIFDDCDALPLDCWTAMLKVIDRAPRQVVVIVVCTCIDVLPRVLTSQCQKFFFPKLRDADIIHTLQRIATEEHLEIEMDALKLIASRSDGSLRDAEMTLEQLSLLGQRISVHLVQELVGLISDEKLVDLLDLALSADTVNTVKNLRDIVGSGIEPLVLMSQLATVITDILAGSYRVMKENPGRKFFQRQELSKEDMEKLQRALRMLSEAEKQLRLSNDRMTWLTATVLQLAPNQHHMLPNYHKKASLRHKLKGNGASRKCRVVNDIVCQSVNDKNQGSKCKSPDSANRNTPSVGVNRREIEHVDEKPNPDGRENGTSASTSGTMLTQKAPNSDQRDDAGDRNPWRSLVRGKVSLAHVILLHAEGFASRHDGWLKRKAVTIAEKLEQQNLRLEARSRGWGLLCWNNPARLARGKRIKRRRPQTLLRSVYCGRCLSGMLSPKEFVN